VEQNEAHQKRPQIENSNKRMEKGFELEDEGRA
jgi:hypothetical protein